MSGLEIIASVVAVAGAALQLATLTSDFGFQLSTATRDTEAFAARLRLLSDAARDLGRTFEKALETLEPDDLTRNSLSKAIEDAETFLKHILGIKMSKPVPGNAARGLMEPFPSVRLSSMVRLRWVWGRKHLSRLKEEMRDLQGDMVVLVQTMQLKIALYVFPIRPIRRSTSRPVRRSEQRSIQLVRDLSTRLGPTR
ncbi:hypothetical protein MMC22_008384 [Lobaria immixta]|nr:hypothetical protein [Lobaria immixta]